MLRLVSLVLCFVSLSGCYYMQAVKGQLELTRERESIVDILQDESTPAELSARLQLVQEARQFSIEELGLPDNGSYRSYADIKRDYVVWNVIAAPEFSLQPRTWCFPIAGCVGYRGYFSKEAAEREAERLAAKGFDVSTGGVAAYSTLGKLKDPVISSMMNWDDTQLVAVLFHELAHQVLYVKGDSGFNESFATAVEEFGVHRWLAANGSVDDIDRYNASRQLRTDLMGHVARAREDLEPIYSSELPDKDKRQQKAARLDVLAQDVSAMLANAGRDPGGWRSDELNNARLASMVLYEGRLPEFRALFDQCEQDIACFYDAARRLAGR